VSEIPPPWSEDEVAAIRLAVESVGNSDKYTTLFKIFREILPDGPPRTMSSFSSKIRRTIKHKIIKDKPVTTEDLVSAAREAWERSKQATDHKQSLQKTKARNGGAKRVRDYCNAQPNKVFTAAELVSVKGGSAWAIHDCLIRLVKNGKLKRVGANQYQSTITYSSEDKHANRYVNKANLNSSNDILDHCNSKPDQSFNIAELRRIKGGSAYAIHSCLYRLVKSGKLRRVGLSEYQSPEGITAPSESAEDNDTISLDDFLKETSTHSTSVHTVSRPADPSMRAEAIAEILKITQLDEPVQPTGDSASKFSTGMLQITLQSYIDRFDKLNQDFKTLSGLLGFSKTPVILDS